jgi:lipoteichoic acid synthase
MKNVRQLFILNQDVLAVSVLIMFKALFLNYVIQGNANAVFVAISSLFIVLPLTSICTMLPKMLRRIYLVILDLIFSLLLLADFLFYHFFHNVIPLAMIYEANQMSSVDGSIATAISPIDLLFFVDLLLVVPYFIYLHIKSKNSIVSWKFRLINFGVSLVLSIVILTSVSLNVQLVYGKQIFDDIHSNNVALDHMGPLYYHAMDVEQSLTNNTNGSTLPLNELKTWMSVHHQTEDGNKYYGIAKGKRIIVVQMESLQGFLIGKTVDGQEVTPNLNKFMKESVYFPNYFTQIAQGNTADSEFMSLNSLYPLSTGSVYNLYNTDTFDGLPRQLKKVGYSTYAIHSFYPQYYDRDKMYPNEGIDTFYDDEFFKIPTDQIVGMGLSDEQMFNQAVDLIKKEKNPSFSFVISLSGHHPYNIPDKLKTLKISRGEFSPLFENYLQAQHYADKAFGEFIDKLKKEGMLEDSLIVVYGDHFAPLIQPADIQKFLGLKEYSTYEDVTLKKVPLFIRFPNHQVSYVDYSVGGQMDLYPTIANLVGLDKSKLFYFGEDLFNAKDRFVAFRFYEPQGTFITNDIVYAANQDGIFEHGICYDLKTGKRLDVSKAKAGYMQAQWELHMSDLIIKNNAATKLTK